MLAAITLACGKSQGELAFSRPDESQMTEMEKTYFVPRRFHKIVEPAIFPEGGKLWFSYKPPLRLYGSRTYAFSLQKKSLGFIEIDLRNITLTPGITHLVDFYENLEPGDYLLKIADIDGLLMEYNFEIAENDSTRTLDYDVDPDGQSSDTEDEIISLSR